MTGEQAVQAIERGDQVWCNREEWEGDDGVQKALSKVVGKYSQEKTLLQGAVTTGEQLVREAENNLANAKDGPAQLAAKAALDTQVVALNKSKEILADYLTQDRPMPVVLAEGELKRLEGWFSIPQYHSHTRSQQGDIWDYKVRWLDGREMGYQAPNDKAAQTFFSGTAR